MSSFFSLKNFQRLIRNAIIFLGKEDTMKALPVVLIGTFVLWGIYSLFAGSLLGIGMGIFSIGLGVAMFVYGLKEIVASPPEKGLLTIWKTRYNIVLNEGYNLVAPYFPFFIDFIRIKMEKVNADFPVTFRCKAKLTDTASKKIEGAELDDKTGYVAGPEVKMSTGMTYIPDEDHLINFIDYGQQKGVEEALQNILDKVWREEGSQHTIEELISSRDDLMTKIYYQIFGDHIEVKDLQKSIEYLQKNGKSDAHNLGIKIMRINIANPEIVDAQVKVAMEAQAKEEFQRRSETFELETEMDQAEKLYRRYEGLNQTKTFESCLLEIRRRKSLNDGRGMVIDIAGLGNMGGQDGNVAQALVAAAAVHGAASNQQSKGPQTPNAKGGKQ